MPHYKLLYFDVRAIGEPIRMILHYMGKEFEDVRVSFEEWTTKLKKESSFGKLPILEIDGKQIHQSQAICRYLAKEAKLCGDNDWEELQIDIIVDTFQDFRKEVSIFHHESDAALKEKKKANLIENMLPFYFGKFDEILKENGGYLANGKLSWADFYIGGFSDSLTALLQVDLFEKYPNISAWKKRFFEIPQVKDWVSKRPDSKI